MESPVARTGRAFAVTGTGRRQGGAVRPPHPESLRNLFLLIMLPVVPFCERREKLERLFGRSALFGDRIDEAVRRIVEEVRSRGDAAVLDYTERFDGVRPASLRVDVARLAEAHACLDDALRGILVEAADNIRRFHEKQLRASWFDTEEDGAGLGQRYVPIERAGVYVPGGTAAYPSSVLMNVIPAQVAGVEHLYLASPPGPDGLPHPLVLAAAHVLGVDRVFAAGGAQAIAMFAFGTETVPRVDKITGPGNAYVATAKKQVYGMVDIDSVAGPSEIVVLADSEADPRFAAADLLAQAEHDVDASAVLLTTSKRLARWVAAEVSRQLETLTTREVASKSIARNSAVIVVSSSDEAMELANRFAPEHLSVPDASWLDSVKNAGSIFVGSWSPEAAGDYASGPNHVLPTGGGATLRGGLSVLDYVKIISVQELNEKSLRALAPAITTLARAEGLEAHARSIEARLDG